LEKNASKDIETEVAASARKRKREILIRATEGGSWNAVFFLQAIITIGSRVRVTFIFTATVAPAYNTGNYNVAMMRLFKA